MRKVRPNEFEQKPISKNTVILCTKCGFYQEMTGDSSKFVCPHCRPIKKCAHGVYVTVDCASCLKIYPNNKRMRLM